MKQEKSKKLVVKIRQVLKSPFRGDYPIDWVRVDELKESFNQVGFKGSIPVVRARKDPYNGKSELLFNEFDEPLYWQLWGHHTKEALVKSKYDEICIEEYEYDHVNMILSLLTENQGTTDFNPMIFNVHMYCVADYLENLVERYNSVEELYNDVKNLSIDVIPNIFYFDLIKKGETTAEIISTFLNGKNKIKCGRYDWSLIILAMKIRTDPEIQNVLSNISRKAGWEYLKWCEKNSDALHLENGDWSKIGKSVVKKSFKERNKAPSGDILRWEINKIAKAIREPLQTKKEKKMETDQTTKIRIWRMQAETIHDNLAKIIKEIKENGFENTDKEEKAIYGTTLSNISKDTYDIKKYLYIN